MDKGISASAEGAVRIQLRGQTLELHPLKGIYWVEKKALLLADLHLGKAAHFRRAGIAVPPGVQHENYDRLINLLLEYRPERVLLLGDLFHSELNASWQEFSDLLAQFSAIRFELIPGNHDILDPVHYLQAGLLVHPLDWVEGPFLLTHHPRAEYPAGLYGLAGHLHPGIRLYGAGRQSLRLPCYYFGEKGGVLPAFGAFTGVSVLTVEEEDQVYAITATEVVGV